MHQRATLRRIDLILLPLIFIDTVIVLLAGGEAGVRLLYPQIDAAEPCEILTPQGFRYRPFCTSQTKVWEGPWITQHFNDCGYRTAECCARGHLAHCEWWSSAHRTLAVR